MEIGGEESIKIEQVRDLGYKLSLKPYAAKYKIALIDNAHNLTVEAANALLKVLEEPKPFTILFLITDNTTRLLPTISSRAQKINFGPLDDLAWEIDDSSKMLFQDFISGSLGKKLSLVVDLAEKETPDLKNTIEYWLHSLERKLREEPSEILLKKIKGVLRAQRLLDQNVNSKLLLSELMVSTS
jgi:DNA polymerase III delta prime subunit